MLVLRARPDGRTPKSPPSPLDDVGLSTGLSIGLSTIVLRVALLCRLTELTPVPELSVLSPIGSLTSSAGVTCSGTRFIVSVLDLLLRASVSESTYSVTLLARTRLNMLVLSSFAKSPAVSDLRLSSFFFSFLRWSQKTSDARQMARKIRAKTAVRAMLAFVQYPESGFGFWSVSATRLLSTGIGAMMMYIGVSQRVSDIDSVGETSDCR